MFNARSSGQPADIFLGSPTVSLYNQGMRGIGGVIGDLTSGRSPSQHNIREAASILPLQNMMPFAQIHMLEGRTEDQKRAVIEKVTQALHEAVGAPKETIRILISEVPKAHWGIGGTSAKDLGR